MRNARVLPALPVLLAALPALAALAARPAYSFSDETFELPELFHLDEYDRCLSEPQGLYCVGTFQLHAGPEQTSLQYYRAVEEYSSDPLNFNRTLVHRGCCVSRCSGRGSPRQRFQRCVRQREAALGLRLTLREYHCETGPDPRAPPERRDQVFLWALGALLFLNALGTLYDVNSVEPKKNKILMAWSMRENWRRLTTNHESGDPMQESLAPIQGARVIMMALVIITHVTTLVPQLFVSNPEAYERIMHHPATMLMRNGTSIVQVSVVLSNFLFAHCMIVLSKNRNIGFSQLPLCILHRIVRLMPQHLAVVGFAATWWRMTGSGPVWGQLVTAESDACHRKFFKHALFLNNIVDKDLDYNDQYCLLPTWFVATDLQLLVVAAVVTLTLMKMRVRPLPVLLTLFVLSALANGVFAYFYNWKSLVDVMVPERIREKLRYSNSFRGFYITPWGSLPACFIGLAVAHLHHDAQKDKFKLNKNNLLVWIYHMTVPLLLAWFMGGVWIDQHKSPLVSAVYIALERPILTLLCGVYLLGILNNVDNPFRRLLSWRRWNVLGRVSLAALLLHWCVMKTIVGSRRSLTEFSLQLVTSEICATMFFTYLIAVPLTILVEMPFMKTFTTLLLS